MYEYYVERALTYVPKVRPAQCPWNEEASSKLLLATDDDCRFLQDFVRVDLPVFFDNDV